MAPNQRPMDIDENSGIVYPPSRELCNEVILGNIPEMDYVKKFGENPDIDLASTPEDVWDYGGIYTFTANGGASMFISSSDASDTELAEISILSEDGSGDWNRETISATLDGQTKTAISTPSGDPIVRVRRVKNVNGSDFNGDVYVYEDDTVIGGIPQTDSKVRALVRAVDTDNQTLMMIDTIPSGFVGLIVGGSISVSRAQATTAVCSIRVRPHNGVFQTKLRVAVNSNGTSSSPLPFYLSEILEPKSDFLVRVDSVTANNTGISANLDVKYYAEHLRRGS